MKKFLNDEDPKLRWKKILNTAGINKDEGDDGLKIQTEHGLTSDPVLVADHFNAYFVSKVQKLKERTSPNKEEALKYMKLYLKEYGNFATVDFKSFSFRCVEWDEIWEAAMQLNNSNSTGVDGIPSTVIKKCLRCLVKPIQHIVNLILMSSKYPDLWKEGVIRPLFKSGDKTLASNYRPLSLQCSIGKIAEKIMCSQLEQYLRSNLLMSGSQHAYQARRSCQTALTEFDSFVCRERCDGKDVVHVGTDQSGAYNCADHGIFLGKLELLGLDDTALKLMESYLTGRRTRAKIGSHVSGPVELSAGFPEGSCLSCFNWLVNIIDVSVVSKLVEMDLNGPTRVLHFAGLDRTSSARSLLPAVYNTTEVMSKISVRDLLPKLFTVLPLEYSDDISCLMSGKGDKNLQPGINRIMDRFSHYFACNGLAMNLNKSSLITFRYNSNNPTKLFVSDIPEKKVLKFLGVHFDFEYTFQTQMNLVRKTVNWKVSKLKPIAKYLSEKTRKETVSALCYGSMGYCFQIWGRHGSIRNQAQRVQNQINRCILIRKARSSRSQMLMDLKYLKVDNWYRYLCVTDLYKYLRFGGCPYTVSLLDNRSRPYYMRRQNMMLNFRPKIVHGIASFINQAVATWNLIDVPGIKFKTFADLKVEVKGILFEDYNNFDLPP